MSNVIFLDFDGVITNARIGYFNMDIYNVNFLRWICQQADVRIVISSTWRHHYKRAFWKTIFSEYLHKDWATPATKFSGSRGHDIQRWLEEHPDTEKYLIIDDDYDMLKEQQANFIRTNTFDGILYKDMVAIRDFWGINGYLDNQAKLYIHKNMFAHNLFKIMPLELKIRFI